MSTASITQPARQAQPEKIKLVDRGKVKHRKEALSGYLFAAPALILFVFFIAIPILGTIALSFTRADLLTGQVPWAGVSNYARMGSDSQLGKVLINTFVFSLCTAAAHIVIGLLLAVAVNSLSSRFMKAWSSIAFVFSFFVSAGAAALMAKYLLSPDFGPVNYYLSLIGINGPNWLSDPHWAMFSIIVLDLWQTVGFTFLIFLVGLQGISPEYAEAAKVDGAGPVRRFFRITVPLISPTTLFATIVSFAGAFQMFTWPYIVTAGGPAKATKTVVYYIYESAFRNFNIGYGAALGVLTIVILGIFTALQMAASKKWVHYER